MAVRLSAVRPREVSAAATRRAIVAAAEGLLASAGEDGLSIRELCARARVTPPTVYHHFGDKRALVDRVVDDCFAAFERALARRPAPADPVAALSSAFDHYLEYGLRHPAHYRLMFQRRGPRATPASLAAYDRLRRMVTAVDAAGRLRHPIEDATAACWAAAHGATALVVAGYLSRRAPAVTLVREALIAHLTTATPAPRRRPRGGPA